MDVLNLNSVINDRLRFKTILSGEDMSTNINKNMLLYRNSHPLIMNLFKI